MTLYVPRAGKVIATSIKVETFTRPKDNDPIGAYRVIGVDTESLKTQTGELKTVLLPYSSFWGDVVQTESLEDYENDPIYIMIDFTMKHFGETYDRPSRVIHRLNKGTRETITPVLWTFYNLEYDLQRLFKGDSDFFRYLRQGRQDVFINIGRYRVQMISCNPTGSAPSFQIIAMDEEALTVCRVYGMDMWGYWKTGLGATAKALGVGEKLSDEVPAAWFDIPMDEWTPEMWEVFTRYAAVDANLTRGIYLATAELLGSFSKAVFNKMGMLPPSAPAAAARMAFAMASKTEWNRPPKAYEQLALDAYHGGYVAAIVRGRVDNITAVDLHSAYPSAMLLLPDPCNCEYASIPPGDWEDIPVGYRKHGNLGFVRVTFTVKPCRFPSISANSKTHTLHQPGTYTKFAISLPELSALFDMGQIDSAKIHHGFLLVGSPETSFLKRFVDFFYTIKSQEEARTELEKIEKDTPMYLAAKLLMNALYGKLIEIHEPKMPALEHEPDLRETIFFPPTVKQVTSDMYKDLAQMYIEGGAQALFAWSRKNIETGIRLGVKSDKVQRRKVYEILQDQKCSAGAYFLPIHASLITAITRAKIGIMLNCFLALMGDTDSCMTNEMTYGSKEWEMAEVEANRIALRAGVGHIKNDPGLLGYGVEMVVGVGFIAGIKQYTLEAPDHKPKLAHHAITDPPELNWESAKGKDEKEKRKNARKDFCKNAVQDLAQGRQVQYMTRSKPRRLRETLKRNKTNYGEFITRPRVIQPKQDERLMVANSNNEGTLFYAWRPLSDFV